MENWCQKTNQKRAVTSKIKFKFKIKIDQKFLDDEKRSVSISIKVSFHLDSTTTFYVDSLKTQLEQNRTEQSAGHSYL